MTKPRVVANGKPTVVSILMISQTSAPARTSREFHFKSWDFNQQKISRTSVHIECGREVSPALSNVKNGVGCKFCSDRGFDYDAPGVVYLLNHPDYQALKIGVTTQTAKNDRIKQHLRNGWKLSRSWETENGALAEVIETAIIGWWRNILGAPEALRSEEMPSGGHTETIAVLYVEPAEGEERVSALLTELNSPLH